MKISIAMATYNGAKYIEEQLQSLAEQTVKPDELVVTDDGSSDETIEIVRGFAHKAPFEIRLERNEKNLGFAQNFGKAMALCSGDIIFLSDQDDVWLPQKLERVRREFRAQPDVQIIINNARIVDGELNDTGLTKLGQTRSLGLGDKAFLTGCCSAIRAEFRVICLPVPNRIFVHDTWLHALGDLCGVRTVLDESLQLYRRHGTNASAALSSTLTPLVKKDRDRAYSGESSRMYTERTLHKVDMLRQRLLEDREATCGVPGWRSSKALARLEAWEGAVRKRLDILSCRRGARIIPAAAMYMRGQYAEFSGWRSLAKDILKP